MSIASHSPGVPVSEDACGSSAHLPDGVCRVAAGALGATRLMEGAPTTGSGRVLVAAFDFDGTCIRGNSPVLLVRHLARKRMLAPSVVARILGWAACYKARLPQNESWVRGLVFRAFAGRPVGEVNRFLYDFYDRFIDERFRADAEAAMRAHEAEGHAVVCVSATFEPIVAAAMEHHPIQYAIATRMKVDEGGRYTDEVAGLPIEGPEKVAVLSRFCDEQFGAGSWELGWAYGDHHSDRSLLAAARHACAVTPDRPLTRTANAEGYDILDW
ncbi:HAD family hydrolase [Adlercreutzia muris]|uniref:HAD family hydrolase n=1 Tax=Adlercreutzia muris TaxID=1796610 RepID=UPI003514ECF9